MGQTENEQRPVFEFKWSNDFFFSTDRYFSNGFDIALYHNFMKKSPTRYILLPSKNADQVWHGITLTQHFFTPVELFDSNVIEGDRPFASYLLVGHKKISLNRKSKLRTESEIKVGILGKYSGGESIQNGIHDILPASEPAIGWDKQLLSDFAINYSARIEKGLINTKNFDLIPHAQARIGIPYTDFEGGVYMRAGKFNNYFSQLKISDNKGIEAYFFVDINARLVGYNATLQGGMFNTNPHVMKEINHFVSDLKSGFVLGFKGFSVEYGQHFISPEFSAGMKHKWGYFTFRFSL